MSKASIEAGVAQRLNVGNATAVEHCRDIGKADMVYNAAAPDIRVDPDSHRRGLAPDEADELIPSC